MDLLQHQCASQESRQADAPLRAYFDQAADALFVQDEHGTIVDLNRQACEDLGYSGTS